MLQGAARQSGGAKHALEHGHAMTATIMGAMIMASEVHTGIWALYKDVGTKCVSRVH